SGSRTGAGASTNQRFGGERPATGEQQKATPSCAQSRTWKRALLPTRRRATSRPSLLSRKSLPSPPPTSQSSSTTSRKAIGAAEGKEKRTTPATAPLPPTALRPVSDS